MRMGVLSLTLLLASAFLILGCDDNNDNSGSTFTENQFVEDPALRANPETDTVVHFLEPPSLDQAVNSRDVGRLGVDEIPLSYDRTVDHNFCIETNSPDSEHLFEFVDGGGNTLKVLEGPCTNIAVPPGDYTLRVTHDGLSDDTHPVFIIPNPDELENSVTQNGLINKAKQYTAKVLNLVTDQTVEDARAQTTTLETLISTRRCIGCDLKGTALNFRDLTGVDLTGAKLQKSNLTGSNLINAELTGANVKNADLTRANFHSADLTVVKNIDTATLTGAKFAGATWTDGTCMCDIVGMTPTGSITVGQGPVSSAHHPNNSTLYVANGNDGTVSVIDTTSNTVSQTITVGNILSDITISPNGNTLYVLSYDESNVNLPGTLNIISTSTNKVTDTMDAGDDPSSVLVTPSGGKLYVANNDMEILIFDTSTNTNVGSITNITAGFLAITPDGKTLFATDVLTNMVSVITTSTDVIIDTITVGGGPDRAVVSERDILYVPNNRSNSVSVVDAITNDVTATVNVGLSPTSCSSTSEGAFIFVTAPGTPTLDVIDSFSNTVVDQADLQFQSYIASSSTLSPDDHFIYISNLGFNTVTEIALQSIGQCGGCE